MPKPKASSQSKDATQKPTPPTTGARPTIQQSSRPQIMKSGASSTKKEKAQEKEKDQSSLSISGSGPSGQTAPPLFPPGYKTPITILNERCQKLGWERPLIEARRLPRKAFDWAYRLEGLSDRDGRKKADGEDVDVDPTLKDQNREFWAGTIMLRRQKKGSSGEMEEVSFMVPKEHFFLNPIETDGDVGGKSSKGAKGKGKAKNKDTSGEVDGDQECCGVRKTKIEARHWGAVYALHRFSHSLSLNLTLPPPCRPYWQFLEREKNQLLSLSQSKGRGPPSTGPGNHSNNRAGWDWMYESDPWEGERQVKEEGGKRVDEGMRGLGRGEEGVRRKEREKAEEEKEKEEEERKDKMKNASGGAGEKATDHGDEGKEKGDGPIGMNTEQAAERKEKDGTTTRATTVVSQPQPQPQKSHLAPVSSTVPTPSSSAPPFRPPSTVPPSRPPSSSQQQPSSSGGIALGGSSGGGPGGFQKSWKSAPVVRMSPVLREMVEATIRGAIEKWEVERGRLNQKKGNRAEGNVGGKRKAGQTDKDKGKGKGKDKEEKKEEVEKLRKDLNRIGFRPGQVEKALEWVYGSCDENLGGGGSEFEESSENENRGLLDVRRLLQADATPKQSALEYLQTVLVPEEDLPELVKAGRPVEKGIRIGLGWTGGGSGGEGKDEMIDDDSEAKKSRPMLGVGGVGGVKLSWMVERVEQGMGIKREEVERIVDDEAHERRRGKTSGELDQGVLVDLILRRLGGWDDETRKTDEDGVEVYRWSGKYLKSWLEKIGEKNDVTSTTEDFLIGLKERMDMEIETLESLYGERFQKLGGEGDDLGVEATHELEKRGWSKGTVQIEIEIPPSDETSTSFETIKGAKVLEDSLILRVIFHPKGIYPSSEEDLLQIHSGSSIESKPPVSIPTFQLFSRTPPYLPFYIRTHLTSLMLDQFDPIVSSVGPDSNSEIFHLLQLGMGGVITEMVEFLSTRWRKVVEDPPRGAEVWRRLQERDWRTKEKDRFLLRLKNISGEESGEDDLNGMKEEALSAQTNRGPSRGLSSQHRVADVSDEVHLRLKKKLEETRQKAEYRKLLMGREKLPAYKLKDEIVELVRNNRVVIVSGATGSGKTTQVPTFILDHEALSSRGGSCSILVTQPRRVSAIGVAQRVAQERLEDINSASSPGSDALVGYAIRGERKASRACRMLFATTGVALARMSRGGDRDLKSFSHVFVDEVHERSLDSDFLILELREVLKRNPNIKVILMSATINQEAFSKYFDGAPCIDIPGVTHPVQDFYLENIIPLTNYHSTSAHPTTGKMTQAQLDQLRSEFNSQGVANARHLDTLQSLSRSEQIDYDLIGSTVAWIVRENQKKNDANKQLESEGGKPISGDGILCFLPGVGEIRQAMEGIRDALDGKEKGMVEILPLHANLSSKEQTEVFKTMPKGKTKIVVATNIAETSITIDDITSVIDTGRVKETSFDPSTSLTRLLETYTSLAGSKQRRGRAGRTSPGKCFKLFTRWVERERMAEQQRPEIRRVALETVVLTIMAMMEGRERQRESNERMGIEIEKEEEGGDVKKYLAKALDPPDVRAVESAWEVLMELGAIEERDGKRARLTPLGMHLSMIPVDLRLGKMIILSTIFDCLSPILTISASLSCKPLFLNPQEPSKRDEARMARERLIDSFQSQSRYVRSDNNNTATKKMQQHQEINSDLILSMLTYDSALEVKNQNGFGAFRKWCEDHFVSMSTIREIGVIRGELDDAIRNVSASSVAGSSANRRDNKPSSSSSKGINLSLLKSIIFAGLGLKGLAKIEMPKKRYEQTFSGTVEKGVEGKEVRVWDVGGSENAERVFLHPSSILFGCTKFSSPFLSYFGKHVTSKVWLRDVTEVPTYAILFFGGRVRSIPPPSPPPPQQQQQQQKLPTSSQQNSSATFDNNNKFEGGLIVESLIGDVGGRGIKLKAWTRIGVLVNQLRRLLDKELEERVEDARFFEEGKEPSEVIKTMLAVLEKDGVASSF